MTDFVRQLHDDLIFLRNFVLETDDTLRGPPEVQEEPRFPYQAVYLKDNRMRHSLAPKYTGPYPVVAVEYPVIVIRKDGGDLRTNIDNVKPCTRLRREIEPPVEVPNEDNPQEDQSPTPPVPELTNETQQTANPDLQDLHVLLTPLTRQQVDEYMQAAHPVRMESPNEDDEVNPYHEPQAVGIRTADQSVDDTDVPQPMDIVPSVGRTERSVTSTRRGRAVRVPAHLREYELGD